MACRRFAGVASGLSVTLIKTIAIAVGAVAAVTSLAGCATAPPFTIEEQLWFDKATGPDITRVPPGLRMREAIGFPHPVHRGYPPPPGIDEP